MPYLTIVCLDNFQHPIISYSLLVFNIFWHEIIGNIYISGHLFHFFDCAFHFKIIAEKPIFPLTLMLKHEGVSSNLQYHCNKLISVKYKRVENMYVPTYRRNSVILSNTISYAFHIKFCSTLIYMSDVFDNVIIFRDVPRWFAEF